jgi:hypothetical protein
LYQSYQWTTCVWFYYDIISWYALTLHFFHSASSITRLNFSLSNMFFFGGSRCIDKGKHSRTNAGYPKSTFGGRCMSDLYFCMVFVCILFSPLIILCGTYFAGKFASSKKIYWVCKWKGRRHRCDPRCPTWPAVGEGIPIL